MMLSTLKVIEDVLRAEVRHKEKIKNASRNMVRHWEEVQMDKPEEFDLVELQSWKEIYERQYNEYITASNALRDFLGHDWS